MNFCTSNAEAFDPGFWNPLGRLASQYEFTSKLLRFWNTLTLPSGHLSKLTDLILLMCVPNDRCYPEKLKWSFITYPSTEDIQTSRTWSRPTWGSYSCSRRRTSSRDFWATPPTAWFEFKALRPFPFINYNDQLGTYQPTQLPTCSLKSVISKQQLHYLPLTHARWSGGGVRLPT